MRSLLLVSAISVTAWFVWNGLSPGERSAMTSTARDELTKAAQIQKEAALRAATDVGDRVIDTAAQTLEESVAKVAADVADDAKGSLREALR